MKKKLSFVTLLLFVFPVSILAVSENAQGSVVKEQTSVETQTKNSGEETQIQTRTEEQVQEQINKDVNETKQQYQAKNEDAKSRSSEVAKAVQNMLEVANRTNNPEIGEQIRIIAREQNQAEDNANKAMDKIQERSGLIKFFVGADFGQIKEVKKIMEQNQERIRELQQIMAKLENDGDKTEIQNQINVLNIQNLNLANQLQEQTKGFSLFGWIIRWFYGI